jgi:hypothetical protein
MPVEAEEIVVDVVVEEAVEMAAEVAEVAEVVEAEAEATEMAAAETETTTGITSKTPIRRKRPSRLSPCANRRKPTSQTPTTSPPSDADCPFTAF